MSAAPGGGAGTVVRRILVYAILLALVVIAAIGVTGLLERVIGAGRELVADDADLARSLAFTFIAGPLAGVLWWWQRRRLTEPAERASLTWGLYVAAGTTASLIVFTSALASAIAAGIEGEGEPESISVAAVWAAVWVLHWLMHAGARISPTRLASLPVLLGGVYALAVLAVGAVEALAQVIAQALALAEPVLAGGANWWIAVLQSLATAAIGAAVWWWHWFSQRGRDTAGEFAHVVVVVITAAFTLTTLFAAGTVVFVVLRLLFDTDPLVQVLSPLDTALGAVLVGGLLWAYHYPVLARRGTAAMHASRLATSGIALVGAASGFGVVVNALLATFTATLVDDDPRTLLLGGISALAVGFPVWWFAWRPVRAVTAEDAADTGRRVYLIAVFGASAIVAIVTLLLIGYRVFEYVLDPSGFAGFVERVRAPFGLLSATVVVFAYHFAVWRRDRLLARAAEPEAKPTIGRILLAGTGDVDALAAHLHEQLGVRVSTLRVVDGISGMEPEAVPAIVKELRAISAPGVLVVAAGEEGARVFPLAD